jgi:hypothetical protein
VRAAALVHDLVVDVHADVDARLDHHHDHGARDPAGGVAGNGGARRAPAHRLTPHSARSGLAVSGQSRALRCDRTDRRIGEAAPRTRGDGYMGKRRVLLGVGVGSIAILAATACQPFFGTDDTLTASALGQLTRLTWTAAQDDDAGETVVQYGIEVDGTEVSRFPASGGLSCILTGLAGGTTYTVAVTAYGNTGQWSGDYKGDLASMARVATSYTPPTIGAPSGAARTCVAPTDTDGDRLPNALETNTGTFTSAAATGTNPNNADTDADGIRDGDEVLGTAAQLNLYGMGTRPTKKDLLFEFDWFDDANDCGAHSHRPTAAIVDRVKTAFATTPIANPDGTQGVNVIGDYGQGGLFTGGNLIADANGVIAGTVFNSEYLNYKAANYAANRQGYFHYVLLPHRYDTSSGSSGYAEFQGDDMIVSLQCFSGTENTGNTIMHEVGHNLNLRHGGNVDTPNYKNNYNSVMNYKYQFPGVDTDCDSVGNGKLAYSTGSRASLNEASLLETNGVCNGVDIDWNKNGVIDAGAVGVDINRNSTTQLGGTGDGLLSVLTDPNDVALLCLTCVDGAPGASPDGDAEPVGYAEQPTPTEAR